MFVRFINKIEITKLAFGISILSFLTLPIVDLMAKKLLGAGFSVFEIALGRFISHSMVMTTIFLYLKKPFRNIFSEHKIYKIGISFGSVLLTLGFYQALSFMPLTNAITIFFLSPSLVSLFSIFFLKEKIKFLQFIAIFCGFIGILIVIKPDSNQFNHGVFFSLLAALGWSLMVIIKSLGKEKLNGVEVQCFLGISNTFVYLPMVLLYSKSFILWNGYFFLISAGMGFLGAVSYFLLHFANKKVNASFIAPLQYLEIISALILDYLFFDVVPTLTILVGIFFIFLSGWLNYRCFKNRFS